MYKILLLLLLVPISLNAQHRNTDSLLTIVNQPATPDTVKIINLNKLSDLLAEKDSAQAKQYALKAINMAAKNSYWSGLAKGYYQLGLVYDLNYNYKNALLNYNKSIRVARKHKLLRLLANSYQSAGLVNKLQSKYPEALQYNLKALHLFKELKDSAKIGDLYMNVGNNYRGLLAYQKAISYHIQALRIFEKIGKTRSQIKAYNNIGVVYDHIASYPAALVNFKKALELAQKADDQEMIASSYQNIGSIYNNMKQNQKALEYYQKAYPINVKINDKLSQSIGLGNIAECYAELKQYDNCLKYCEKGITISKEIDDNEGTALFNLYRGMAYIGKNEPSKALKSLNTGMQIINKFKLDFSRALFDEQYAQLYFKTGDFKKAYQYQNLYNTAKDSITSKEKNQQINEIQAKYETEKKEGQIALLNQENTIQKLVISRRNFTIGLVILAFLATIAMSGLFYSRYKRKQESRLQKEIIRQQDLATKAVLEAEENERRRISGELHDGLGQMFSTVKLNLSGLEPYLTFKDQDSQRNFANTLDLVDESCKEVRSISHQMAPNVLLKSGLVSAIRDFINHVDQRSLKISLEVQGLTERLDANTETVLYRVIQEAVNNVIKHAQASRLDIQLLRDKDGLSAMIEDDGAGFESTLAANAAGIGLKNIVSRITFLKGTVDFDSSPGNGTVVSVWIPA